MRGIRGGQRGKGRTVHERPVREGERRPGRGHVRPQQHQHEYRGCGEPQPGRDTAPTRTSVDRKVRAHHHVDQEREERHRGGEVRSDDVAGKIALDRCLSEGGLKDHQAKRNERRPQDRRPPAIRHQRGDRGGEREDPHDRRRRPMRPLDDRVRVVEWGNPAAVTGGPLRAAQP